MSPHSAPQAKPTSSMAGMTTIPGVPAGRSGTRTTALPPQAPSRSWPSAPMFQSPIRKARAQASPVSMSGVALTSVSEMTPTLPKAALKMCTYERTGSPPTKARTRALTSRAKATARSGVRSAQRGGSRRRSRVSETGRGTAARRGARAALTGARLRPGPPSRRPRLPVPIRPPS